MARTAEQAIKPFVSDVPYKQSIASQKAIQQPTTSHIPSNLPNIPLTNPLFTPSQMPIYFTEKGPLKVTKLTKLSEYKKQQAKSEKEAFKLQPSFVPTIKSKSESRKPQQGIEQYYRFL